ncbi:MAG: radical SAM protein [Candidatus Altiarchaeota archaeon]|nr:radical SAM protein [Candidatus Altiarchaeota archaeon]
MKCKYCSVMPKKIGSFLDFGTVKNFLEFFSDYAIPNARIILTGGEPTLHPKLLDILDIINELFIDPRIVITTNGLMSETMIENRFEKRVILQVSCGGLPDIHDHERVFHNDKGSSKQVLKSLKRLLELDPNRVIVRLNYAKNRIGREQEIIDFLKSLGVKRVALGYLVPTGWGQDYDNVDTERSAELVPAMKSLLVSNGFGVGFSKIRLEKTEWPSCDAGKRYFNLSIDGKITACININNTQELEKDKEIFVLGDANKTVKLDWPRIHKFRKFASEVPEACKSCSVIEYCGGCPWEKIITKSGVKFKKEFCKNRIYELESLIKSEQGSIEDL